MQRLRLLAGLFVALALTPLAAQPAYAHARPDRADPPIDGVVPTAPATLQVWFTEGVNSSGSSLQVVDGSGNRVDAGDGRVDLNDPDRKRMLVTLQPLADGVYTVNWRTVSADDGDAAEGSFRFGVGASTVLSPQPTGASVPRLTIDSATVNGNEVHLRVGVEGAVLHDDMAGGMDHDGMAVSDPTSMAAGNLPQAHLHVFLNGVMMQMLSRPDITLVEVPSGTHEIRVELSNNLHQDWNPPVVASTTVVVP